MVESVKRACIEVRLLFLFYSILNFRINKTVRYNISHCKIRLKNFIFVSALLTNDTIIMIL